MNPEPPSILPPGTDRSVDWIDGAAAVIDQRALPHQVVRLRLTTAAAVGEAIATLAVRGAPAIGVAAAYAVALSAATHQGPHGTIDVDAVERDARALIATRPTAVNLAWAVHRTLAALPGGADAVLAAARTVHDDTIDTCARAVTRAADLIAARAALAEPIGVLTHCNTGPLSTAAGGTALGTIIELHRRGLLTEAVATETRPLLQGARLTTWELRHAGIPHRLCADSAAATAITTGLVRAVIVGADRIAANGDTANKIGTLPIALAADHHGIPFYVVAPESTLDPTVASGDGITVEQRRSDEVTHQNRQPTAPAGTAAYNPAFDITPARLITAIITEDRTITPNAIPAGDPHA